MAGLGRKEWSPGDTLNAADVNGYLMDQSVMVFAGTAARASAIPTPSAGMVAYSTATQLEYYDGSAWEPIGITPGLTYITQATPSAQTSISINNCFTSAYENYRVVINVSSVAADNSITLRLRVGGVDTSTNYVSQRLGATGGTVFASANVAGTDEMLIANVTAAEPRTTGIVFDIFAPQLVTDTTCVVSYGLVDAINGNALITVWNAQTTSTSFDGFSVLSAGANMTGTIRVYGYQNS